MGPEDNPKPRAGRFPWVLGHFENLIFFFRECNPLELDGIQAIPLGSLDVPPAVSPSCRPDPPDKKRPSRPQPGGGRLARKPEQLWPDLTEEDPGDACRFHGNSFELINKTSRSGGHISDTPTPESSRLSSSSSRRRSDP